MSITNLYVKFVFECVCVFVCLCATKGGRLIITKQIEKEGVYKTTLITSE